MMNAGIRSLVVPAALVLAAAAGCDAQDRDGMAEAAEAVSAEPAESGLSDPQIAHVAVTANAVDAELGELAEARAASEEVRAFGGMMNRDHTAVNGRAAALVERLGVTPEDNDVSRSLRAGGDDARAALEPLSGGAFDRAYMDREVAYHQAVLDALDDTLIPGATNAELRGLLEQVRPGISAHLEHARTVRAGLEEG